MTWLPEIITRLRTSRGVRDFGWLSGGAQITALLSQLGVIVLVRTVSIETAGKVFVAQGAAAMYFIVLDPRFEDAVQRYVPRLAKSGRSGTVTRFFTTMLATDALLGLVFGAVAVALASWTSVGAWLDVPTGYLIIAIVAATAGSASGTAQAGFAVVDGIGQGARIKLILAVAQALLIVVATVLFSAWGYLVAVAAGNALTAGVLGFASMIRVRGAYGAAEPIGETGLEGYWPFLAKSALATSFAQGTDQALVTIAGAAGAPALAAQLRVAIAPGRLATSAISPVASVLFPRMSRAAAAEDAVSVRELARRTTRHLAVPVVVATTLSWPALAVAVPLVYGDRYGTVAGAAALFLVAAMTRMLVAWSKVLPLAVGRPGLRLAATVVEFVGLVGIAWWQATQGTIQGIAVGAVAIAIAWTIWWWSVLDWSRLLVEPVISRQAVPGGHRG